MSPLVVHNLKALLVWSLVFLMGFCFGGLTGVGMAAAVLLTIQVFL